MKSKKKTIASLCFFMVLVLLTFTTIIKQSKDFSFSKFWEFLVTANPIYVILAILSMFGFIIFEGLALVKICEIFGYKRKKNRAVLYAAPDIYFSAITPSATGGQPASAYFMMKDKIPGSVTTIALLINLIFYTAAIILVGIISFIVDPEFLLNGNPISIIMIIIGFSVQIFLLLFFFMLVHKEKIVMTIARAILKFLNKLHLIKNIDRKIDRLTIVEKEYKECANQLINHGPQLIKAFIFNVLQRVSQIMVTVFVYLGTGGSVGKIVKLFATQGFVYTGSNSMPIPGAVGVADYLFIDGCNTIGIADPVNLEFLSRGISFYACVIICGLFTLIAYFKKGIRNK